MTLFSGPDVAQLWRLPLADLVAFSRLQFSQIRSRQPYLNVRNTLYVIHTLSAAEAEARQRERDQPPVARDHLVARYTRGTEEGRYGL